MNVPPSMIDASIAYDSFNQHYYAAFQSQDSSEAQSKIDGPRIILFDKEGNKVENIELRGMFSIGEKQDDTKGDGA